MSIIIPNSDFDFSKLKLGNPSGIQGGAYFSKITMNDDQLLIQTPKSTTKNGITTTDKKNCVDFMFNVEQTTFSDWIEQFERKIKELIYQRRDAWFTNEMTMEDIDYFFTPMSRVYKTKFYLVRAFEQKNKMFRSERRYNFGLFGENGEETSGDELANENTQCISILEVRIYSFSQIPTPPSNCLIKFFITPNAYYRGNYVHSFNGMFFNKIPLLNRLKLNEIAGSALIAIPSENFIHQEIFIGIQKQIRIKQQLFRIGAFLVTSDSNIDNAQYSYKFGISYWNTYTKKWNY
jgi:hypothetical protein